MPAVTVENLLTLPRVATPALEARPRPVRSVTTAPRGFEGEGFPVRRAFHGVDMADLDPFIHLDQMGEVEYAPGEPRGVGPLFLTHLHSDHVVGIPDLWITGWFLVARPGARTSPFRVFGPPGTAAMMTHLEEAFVVDREARIVVEGKSRSGSEHESLDVREGLVFHEQGVTVHAIEVDHWHHNEGPVALGYRIEFEGRSVVFSGDTRYSPHLAEIARGCDVLVHEVQLTNFSEEEDAAIRRKPDPASLQQLIMALHTNPWDAGRVFQAARPRLAVYSHVIISPPASEADLVARTRETYEGPLVVGHDLMRIRIGERVEVDRGG